MTAMAPQPTGTHAADAILAAVLPASAASVRVSPDVDTSLVSDAGGSPDVDVLRRVPRRGVGGAPMAVCIVDAADASLDTGTSGRIIVRVRDHARARASASVARGRFHSAGYRTTRAIYWDRGHAAKLPPPSIPPDRLRPAERLPRRAVVAAQRSGTEGPSILQQAAIEGLPGPMRWPLVRSGTLVVVDDALVLRTAIGAGKDRLHRAADALVKLLPILPRPQLVPRLEGTGEVGLGRWTVETRLHGAALAAAGSSQVEDEVIDLLVALRHGGGAASVSIAELAAAVTGALGPGPRSDAVTAATALAAAAGDGLGTSFNHGDFWHGNLLVRDGRLAGVIDWDSAESGRLPFLDVLHFVVAGRVPRGSRRWGAEVVAELQRETPSPLVQRYADAIGVDVDLERLRGLVLAYWIDRLAFQLTTYGDRMQRPRWLELNVDLVVDAVAGMT